MPRLTLFVLLLIFFGGHCKVKIDLVEEEGCIVKKNSSEEPPSLNLLCPNPSQPNLEIIYSSYEDSFPDKECARCSLKLNEDNNAVFLKCYRCQNAFRPPQLVETHKCVETEEQK